MFTADQLFRKQLRIITEKTKQNSFLSGFLPSSSNYENMVHEQQYFTITNRARSNQHHKSGSQQVPNTNPQEISPNHIMTRSSTELC